MEERGLKTAVCVDQLIHKGGVEREIMILAKHIPFDVYTGYFIPKNVYPELNEQTVYSPRDKRLYYGFNQLYLRYQFNYEFNKLKTKKYDNYLLFGGASLHLAKKHHPNVWYCNTPTRWIYDLFGWELKKRNTIKKIPYAMYCFLMRMIDKNNVEHVDRIIANSINVSKRIKKTYGRTSKVIYPPVDTNKFKFIESGDFFLSPTRLDPIRRVDLIVEAFQRMPDKKLVVIGGGSEYDKIVEMASIYPNISILGWVSDDILADLYGKCMATVYMPMDEDFGLIPIESMSSGKPCIGVNEGGVKETIVDGKTGYLIDADVESIVDAVYRMNGEKAIDMREACERRAKLFSEDRFIRQMKKVLEI